MMPIPKRPWGQQISMFGHMADDMTREELIDCLAHLISLMATRDRLSVPLGAGHSDYGKTVYIDRAAR